MTLTDAEIAALVGALVVLANALASYLLNQSSKARAAVTQAKVDKLHAKVDVVEQAVAVVPEARKRLIDGHTVPHG